MNMSAFQGLLFRSFECFLFVLEEIWLWSQVRMTEKPIWFPFEDFLILNPNNFSG